MLPIHGSIGIRDLPCFAEFSNESLYPHPRKSDPRYLMCSRAVNRDPDSKKG